MALDIANGLCVATLVSNTDLIIWLFIVKLVEGLDRVMVTDSDVVVNETDRKVCVEHWEALFSGFHRQI